jgi:hypothetical protein
MANTTTPIAAPGSTITTTKQLLVVHQRYNRQGMQFPWKLHELLEETDKGHSSVVSWLPGGKAFKVHKKQAFCNELMPTFFNSSKYKTFQRSLNLWGFKCVARGTDKGACYYHQFFVRGNVDLCNNMMRVKIKGGGIAGVPPSSEPKTATSFPQEAFLATRLSQLSAAAAPSSKFSTKPVAPSMPAISDFIQGKVSSHSSSNTGTLGNQVAALMPQRRLAAPMTSNPLSLAGIHNSNALSLMSGANTGYPLPLPSFGMQHSSNLGLIPSRNRLLFAIHTAAAALDLIRQEEDAILRQAHV